MNVKDLDARQLEAWDESQVDEFARAALRGLLSLEGHLDIITKRAKEEGTTTYAETARLAYDIAEAMQVESIRRWDAVRDMVEKGEGEGRETHVERFLRQRDRAWRTLAKLESTLGTTDEQGLGFIMANSHGPEDAEEYNRVVTSEPEEPKEPKEINEPY